MNIRPTRRQTIGLAITTAAALVVVASRCGGDPAGEFPADPPTQASPAASTEPSPTTAAPTADTDDGVHDTPAVPSPVIKSGPADPREAAARFAAGWLNAYGKTAEQWRASLTSRITPALAQALADADPTSIPVGVVGDPARLTYAGASLSIVSVPIVSSPAGDLMGALRVTLVSGTGAWLVSEIDWTPL